MLVDFRFSLAGLIIGILIGLTGMGGGSLLAPILILFFRIPPIWAVGTDIAYSTVTKAVGSLVHIRQKTVNFRVALLLGCGSVPATFASVILVQYLRVHYHNFINDVVLRALGVTLIVVAVLLVIKPLVMRRLEQRELERQKQRAATMQEGMIDVTATSEKATRWERIYRPLVTVFVGAFVGFLVGLTSVGSGTLIIVSIAFLFPKLGPKELVGTDIFQAFMLLAAGAIGYLVAGTINWPVVGLLLIGSLPGVLIGSRLSKFIPDRFMRPILATVLAISGLKLI